MSRPRVTFFVTGYEQADTIEEAIEGAFAQTYEPLEILLCDDGSGDATPAIMARMAAVQLAVIDDLKMCGRQRLGKLFFDDIFYFGHNSFNAGAKSTHCGGVRYKCCIKWIIPKNFVVDSKGFGYLSDDGICYKVFLVAQSTITSNF